MDDAALEGLSWQDLVRVQRGGSYEAILNGRGDLAWQEVTDESVAHLVRKKWIAAMLNDDRRAQAYALALRNAKGVVLDVGAGTGLLSQLAASAGAEHVIACEMEPAMANMATRHKKITFAVARSSDVDLPQKAALLVSEIVDTFLVGEGLLPTVRDALSRLCKENVRAIPAQAELSCALLHCPGLLRGPTTVDQNGFQWLRQPCSGGTMAEPHRIAALRAKWDGTKFVTDSGRIMSFDLTAQRRAFTEAGFTELTVSEAAEVHGIVYWWRLELGEGIELTNSPFQSNDQDHWYQGVQALPEPLRVAAGEKIGVRADLNDSETAVRFLLMTRTRPPQLDAFWCACGWHAWHWPPRLRQIPTDPRSLYETRLKPVLANVHGQVLDVGDGAIYSLVASYYHSSSSDITFGAVCSDPRDTMLVSQIAKANGIQNLELVSSTPESSTAAVVWADPYFDALRGNPVMTMVRLLRRFQQAASCDAIAVPSIARVKCAALASPRLRKAYGPIPQKVAGCDQSVAASVWRRASAGQALFALSLDDYADDVALVSNEVSCLEINLLQTNIDDLRPSRIRLDLLDGGRRPPDFLVVYVEYDDSTSGCLAANHVLARFLLHDPLPILDSVDVLFQLRHDGTCTLAGGCSCIR